MELKIQTIHGEAIGVFTSEALDFYREVWVSWLKDRPEIIAQGKSVDDCIRKLNVLLQIMDEFEKYLDPRKSENFTDRLCHIGQQQ